MGDARTATVLAPIDQFEEVFTVATLRSALSSCISWRRRSSRHTVFCRLWRHASYARARARSSQSEPMMRRGRGIGFEKRGYRKLYQLKTWPFVGLPRCSEISEAERTAEVAHGKRRQ